MGSRRLARHKHEQNGKCFQEIGDLQGKERMNILARDSPFPPMGGSFRCSHKWDSFLARRSSVCGCGEWLSSFCSLRLLIFGTVRSPQQGLSPCTAIFSAHTKREAFLFGIMCLVWPNLTLSSWLGFILTSEVAIPHQHLPTSTCPSSSFWPVCPQFPASLTASKMWSVMRSAEHFPLLTEGTSPTNFPTLG